MATLFAQYSMEIALRNESRPVAGLGMMAEIIDETDPYDEDGKHLNEALIQHIYMRQVITEME